MIERSSQDRRTGSRSWPMPGDQRRDFDRRGAPTRSDWTTVAPAMPGAIRPAPGEAAPFVERRRVPESGME